MRFGGRTELVPRRARPLPRALGARARRARASPTTRRSPATASRTTNLLRLWKAEATESFDFHAFNVGDYYGAVDEKVASENDLQGALSERRAEAGKQLRLEQQYFFVSCSLQDMIRLHLPRGARLDDFDETWAVQLNDTHPSIAVAELMRLLVDEHGMDWEQAWDDHPARPAPTPTTRCCPRRSRSGRCRCSARCCRATSRSSTRSTGASSTTVRARYPGRRGRWCAALSLIDETRRAGTCAWRTSPASAATPSTAWPRCTPSCCKQTVLRDFYERRAGEVPQRHQRRHAAPLAGAQQPGLAALITRPHRRRLDRRPRAELRAPRAAGRRRAASSGEWRAVKAANKRALAALHQGAAPASSSIRDSLFDVQVKRSTSTSAST